MQSKSEKTTSSGRLFGYLKLQISLRVSISYVIKTQLQFYTAIEFHNTTSYTFRKYIEL